MYKVLASYPGFQFSFVFPHFLTPQVSTNGHWTSRITKGQTQARHGLLYHSKHCTSAWSSLRTTSRDRTMIRLSRIHRISLDDIGRCKNADSLRGQIRCAQITAVPYGRLPLQYHKNTVSHTQQSLLQPNLHMKENVVRLYRLATPQQLPFTSRNIPKLGGS
jgi:hypothetical protein